MNLLFPYRLTAIPLILYAFCQTEISMLAGDSREKCICLPRVRSLCDWQLSIKIPSKFRRASSFLWVVAPFLKFQSQYPLSPLLLWPLSSTPMFSSSVCLSPPEEKCREDELNLCEWAMQGQLRQPSPPSSSKLFPLLHTRAPPYCSRSPLPPLPLPGNGIWLNGLT